MRTEFEILKKEIDKLNLIGGLSIVSALSNLENKITEVEKRLECARRSNQESNSIVMKLTESFEGVGNISDNLTYDDFEVLQRGVYDVDIALNFNDSEPIDNDWYGLFKEPKQEPKQEPKVLIPKDSIIVWDYSRKYYSAKGGAKARVLHDYTSEHESNDDTIQVEWLDDRANGQENGGYERGMFREEFEKPKRILDTTMGQDMVEDIIQKLIQLDVDGETMGYIIDQVGMAEQMLRQLVMSNPESDTKDLLEEKRMISDEHLNNK